MSAGRRLPRLDDDEKKKLRPRKGNSDGAHEEIALIGATRRPG
jgi:hypothetical protein